MNKPDDKIDNLKTFILVSQLGIYMVVSIVLFTITGFYLGVKYSMETPFLIGGVLLGLCAGFYKTYKTFSKIFDLVNKK